MTMNEPSTVVSATEAELKTRVIEMSLRTLPRMIVPGTQTFCLQLSRDDARAEFAPIFSRRYSIMCLLGLERARRAGLRCDLDLDALFDAASENLHELTIGDVGLLLWLAVRRESPRTGAIVKVLEQRLGNTDLDQLQGMEIGWLVAGTSFYEAFDATKTFGAGRQLAWRLHASLFKKCYS